MRRFLLHWSAGTCLLVPLLTCGCQHNRPCCSPCNAPMAVAMGAPVAVPSRPAAAGDAPAQPAEPVQLAVNTLPPVIQASAKSDPEKSAPARPLFGHDPNYRWLVGTLDYSRIQQAWLLRYAPLEEEDRYGGCVTLVASNRAMNWKPGQLVRVQGVLIDPDSQQLRPAFEVQSLRAE